MVKKMDIASGLVCFMIKDKLRSLLYSVQCTVESVDLYQICTDYDLGYGGGCIRTFDISSHLYLACELFVL